MKKFLRNVSVIVCIFSGMHLQPMMVNAQCSNCNTTGCDSVPVASGLCSFAACLASSAEGDYSAALVMGAAKGARSFAVGESAFAYNLQSVAIGRKVTAYAPYSMAIGRQLIVDSSATNSMVIGYGEPDVILNNIPNSIMMGMNSTLPTLFVQDGGGLNHWGRVGIGTTAPQGILHVRDENGDDTDLVIDRHGTAQANLRFNTGSTGQRARIGLNNSGNHLYYDMVQANSDHIFRVNNDAEVMRVVGSTERVGIGTNAPSNRLHVQAPSTQNGMFRVTMEGGSANQFLLIGNANPTPATHFEPYIVGRTDNADDSGLWLWAQTPNEAGPAVMQFRASVSVSNDPITQRPLFTWANGGSTRMLMKADGNLGIGTTAPGYKLEVNGSAAKPGGGSWIASSDAGLKQNVEDFTDGLETLLQFQPKWYRYTGSFGLPPEPRYVGVIAQEVREIAPYMVDTIAMTDTLNGEVQEFLSYDGTALTYIIVNAIKELEQRVSSHEELVQQVGYLNNQVSDLQQMLSECCNAPSQRLTENADDEVVERNSLGEYVVLSTDPNPFSDHVRISFSIPAQSQKAEIFVSGQDGRLVNRFEVSERGRGEVTFYGSQVSSGIYVCTLVLDGRVSATRRIVKN